MPDVLNDDATAQADDIAAKLIGMLVEGFKEREKRDPKPEEVEELMSELTEERIAELLSGDDKEAEEAVNVKEVGTEAAKEEDDVKEDKEKDVKEDVKEKDVKDDVKEKDVKEGKENAVVEENEKTSDAKSAGEKRVALEDAPEVAAFKWPKV